MKQLALSTLALLSLASPAFADLPTDFVQDTIINGQKVTPDSRVYKMTVQLLMITQKDGQVGVGLCSGTLIAKNLVLTAAHCVKDIDGGSSFVAIGAVLGNGQKIKAEKWEAHPGYGHVEDFIGFAKAKRPVNDIALLKLTEAAGPGSLLAQVPTSHMPFGVSEEMVVAGFGRTNAHDSSSAGTLFFEWTNGELQRVRGGADHQIEMTGVQPCSGDSGGPIFRASESKPLVVLGVTSHVKGQCESSARAISVSHHLPWLRSVAQQWGITIGK